MGDGWAIVSHLCVCNIYLETTPLLLFLDLHFLLFFVLFCFPVVYYN